jgi:hypothetical protein
MKEKYTVISPKFSSKFSLLLSIRECQKPSDLERTTQRTRAIPQNEKNLSTRKTTDFQKANPVELQVIS